MNPSSDHSTKTFVMYGNCVPVNGARRSVICDLVNSKLKFIPGDFYAILTKHKDKPLAEILEAHEPSQHDRIIERFEVLVREEYGFWTDEPERFPQIDLTWDPPGKCTNAIVDIAEESEHDLAAIFDELDELGCWAIQVRAYCELGREAIEQILHCAERGRFRSVELVLKASPATTASYFVPLCEAHQIISRVTLHSADEDVRVIAEPLPVQIVSTKTRLESARCGRVDPRSFSLNVAHFAEAQCSNTCLHRKVSIATNGDIKACPSMKASYGNVRTERLGDAIENPELQKLWRITKDQVEVCRDCEFRYVCTDCRANTDGGLYGKPSTCSYDPYTARWN